MYSGHYPDRREMEEAWMKAGVFTGRRDSGMVALSDAQMPRPKDGEVLVAVEAASVNAADYRSMRMRIVPKGKIMGADIAGRVVEVGKGAQRFKPGDAVLGDISVSSFGGFAEYAAVPETALVLKPEGMSFEDAAALPMASLTALQALRLGGIRARQKVLIVGAGGGVGTFAVQLARHFGADVTAVCGARNAELAKSLGAKHVIDYSKEDFTKSGERYDLIMAINGKRSIRDYHRSLAPGGACVVVGGALSQVFGCMVFGPFLSSGGRRIRLLAAKPRLEDILVIAKLVQRGAIRPVIDRRYPLTRVAEAVDYAAGGHAQGKVIVTIGSERQEG
jgi:NADPH:quinone reductase-like Zn-dependent oxidoreductase